MQAMYEFRTYHHIPHNASSFHYYCSYDESSDDDDHPFGSTCCVHYDDLAADNCYYLSQENVASLNPSTDCSVDSLLPRPA